MTNTKNVAGGYKIYTYLTRWWSLRKFCKVVSAKLGEEKK